MEQDGNKSLLDLQIIDKVNQKYEDKKEVTLHLEYEGTMHESVVYIDKVFSPTKIKICVEGFIEQMRYAKIAKIPFDAATYELYMVFSIIKNFSSLELPNKLEEQVLVLYKMINNNILLPIFSEFDPKEIEKMNFELLDVVQRLEAHGEALQVMLEDANLENADLLTMQSIDE